MRIMRGVKRPLTIQFRRVRILGLYLRSQHGLYLAYRSPKELHEAF